MLDGAQGDAPRWYDGLQFRVLVDGSTARGLLTLCEIWLPAGAATSVHRHEREDELVYVTAGTLDIWVAGAGRTLPVGESVLLPRELPHRLAAGGDGEARALVAFLPGGVEQVMRAASAAELAGIPEPDDLAALLAAAGIAVLPWVRPGVPGG